MYLWPNDLRSKLVYFVLCTVIGSSPIGGGFKATSKKRIRRQWEAIQHDRVFVDSVYDS